MKQLSTTDEVIETLGGTESVMSLTDATSPQQVSNWRARGFPARFHLVMTSELARLGFEAPAKLWGMVEPRAAASEATPAI